MIMTTNFNNKSRNNLSPVKSNWKRTVKNKFSPIWIKKMPKFYKIRAILPNSIKISMNNNMIFKNLFSNQPKKSP